MFFYLFILFISLAIIIGVWFLVIVEYWDWALVVLAIILLRSLLKRVFPSGENEKAPYPLDDDRPFFLFLRSFSDARLLEYPKQRKWDAFRTHKPHTLNWLAGGLSSEGRCLALTTISERRDFSEIILIREDNERWPLTFRLLARKSRALFLVPSVSGGLMQEIDFLLRDDLLDKTIVFMPPISRNFRRLGQKKQLAFGWRNACDHLSRTIGANLPEYDFGGMLFIPNLDFSPKKSFSLNKSFRKLGEALEQLLEPPDEHVRPLRDALRTLQQIGFIKEKDSPLNKPTFIRNRGRNEVSSIIQADLG